MQENLIDELQERGLTPSFIDAFGVERQVGGETLEELKEVLRTSDTPSGKPLICTPGRHHPELYGVLTLENGGIRRVDGVLEEDGYHNLLTDDGQRRFVISAPEHFPQPNRTWGWAVQLYAARSKGSWGIGDFRDLAMIARKAHKEGAGAILISPVHAAAPVRGQQASPYSPASRAWLNLLHLAPGLIPGAELVDISDLAWAGRDLNKERIIDRAKVWDLKKEAFERIWEASKGNLPKEALNWIEDQGENLRSFALWSTLVEINQEQNWRSWPLEQQDPHSSGNMKIAEEYSERILFHSWLQWVADLQFGYACSQGVDIVADLAVGFDSSSADAWLYQDQLAFGFEVGCPPDRHNTDGQRWGLPPFDPNSLREHNFEAFISMARAGLRRAGALRIDHVMQLWRLYWVPQERGAAAGAYIRFPVDELLAILRVEAGRKNAWVVGEDMGTVAEGVRETMGAVSMLGYRAATRTNPDDFPEGVMGASSTHDQATLAGLLTGSDAADLRRIGKGADFEHIEKVRLSLAEMAGVDPDVEPGEEDVKKAVLAQYAKLARSKAKVVVATLDDAGMVRERPNMPGTVDAWPNWKLSLPVPVEELLESELASELASSFRSEQR